MKVLLSLLSLYIMEGFLLPITLVFSKMQRNLGGNIFTNIVAIKKRKPLHTWKNLIKIIHVLFIRLGELIDIYRDGHGKVSAFEELSASQVITCHAHPGRHMGKAKYYRSTQIELLFFKLGRQMEITKYV